jgi:hypothetical protein
MPVQLAASRLEQSSQFMLRADVLNSVLIREPPPTNAPQPIGNTPFWSATTPDGTNSGVFHESATGNAVYFPSYAIGTFDDGKKKVRFSQPDKSNVATTLTITLVPQPPTAAQSGATAVTDQTIPIAVSLHFSNGMKELPFDQVVFDSGNLVCTAHMTDATMIGEVMGSLVGHDSQGPHPLMTVTRTISVGVLVSQPAQPAQPAQPQPAPHKVFTGPIFLPQHEVFTVSQPEHFAPLLMASG